MEVCGVWGSADTFDVKFQPQSKCLVRLLPIQSSEQCSCSRQTCLQHCSVYSEIKVNYESYESPNLHVWKLSNLDSA